MQGQVCVLSFHVYFFHAAGLFPKQLTEQVIHDECDVFWSKSFGPMWRNRARLSNSFLASCADVGRTFYRYLMRSLEKEDEEVGRQNFLRPSTRYRRQKLNKSTTLFPFWTFSLPKSKLREEQMTNTRTTLFLNTPFFRFGIFVVGP